MSPSLQRQSVPPNPVAAAPGLLDVPRLDEWAPQWDRLVDSSPLPSPFLRSWWLSGTGGAGRHFLLVVEQDELIGGLALEQRHRASSVRVMGDGPLCPDHVDLLAAPGHASTVVELVGDWFRRPGGRLVDLRGVREGSALAQILPGSVRREQMAAAPYAVLPDSAEAFRQSLPSQFRRNLRKATGRLTEEGVGHRIVRGPAVLSSLHTLRHLHAAQWEGRSNFLPEFDRFLAGCAGGVTADEVVVHELARDDLVVATVLAFEVAGRVSLYQSARLTDARWRDVTTALLAAIIDDACTRNFKEVDFLRGEETYKSRFTTTQRSMSRLVGAKGVIGELGRAGTAAAFHATNLAVRGVRYGRSLAARRKS
jgi:CelD/BcsL family acetyltransferase involved in cellulose biosynthesis